MTSIDVPNRGPVRRSSAPSLPVPPTPERLEASVRSASSRAAEYEASLKALNGRLTEQLRTFREVHGRVGRALEDVQSKTRSAHTALHVHVPHIHTELDRSIRELQSLAHTLPTVQTQISDIRHIYDSGRDKARALVADLEWLNTDFPARWRTILFTSRAPISWRWKAAARALFALIALVLLVLAYVTLRGAYRAHRQRLVWGERLMS